MNRKELFDYVKKIYHTDPDYPWADKNAVLRHRKNRKWYGLVMEVGKDKLGLSGDGAMDILNIKCDPLLISSLRLQPGFFPAYHMNKEQWISIQLDRVPEETIKNLLSLSWEMTGPKKKDGKKQPL